MRERLNSKLLEVREGLEKKLFEAREGLGTWLRTEWLAELKVKTVLELPMHGLAL